MLNLNEYYPSGPETIDILSSMRVFLVFLLKDLLTSTTQTPHECSLCGTTRAWHKRGVSRGEIFCYWAPNAVRRYFWWVFKILLRCILIFRQTPGITTSTCWFTTITVSVDVYIISSTSPWYRRVLDTSYWITHPMDHCSEALYEQRCHTQIRTWRITVCQNMHYFQNTLLMKWSVHERYAFPVGV